MNSEQVKERVLAKMPDAEVLVEDPRGSGDYYVVSVESGLFSGQSRVKQHRMVQDLFEEELRSGEIHALSIKTKVVEP